jgi:hypothetical protein
LDAITENEDEVKSPTKSPSKSPTKSPSKSPTKSPSKSPTKSTTKSPTAKEDKVTEKEDKVTEKKPLEVTITAGVTFEKKLDQEQITEVSDAMEENVADDLGIPQKYVTAEMSEKDARRRLLAVTYEVVITVSIPGAEAAEMVAENPKMAELSDPKKIAAVSNSFEESLGGIPELKTANGGKAVTVLVKVELVSVSGTDTSEPSSAAKVSSAFGVLAWAMFVACTV